MSTFLDELEERYFFDKDEETTEKVSTLDRLSKDEEALQFDDALDPSSPNYAPLSTTDENLENLQPEYRGEVLPFSEGIREDGTYGLYFDPTTGALGGLQKAFNDMFGKNGVMQFITTKGEEGIDPASEEGLRAITNIAAMVTPTSQKTKFRMREGKNKTITPTTKQLKVAAGNQYEEAKNMGAEYSAKSVKKLVKKIKETEFVDNFPVEEMPKLTKILKRLEKQPKGATGVPLQTIIKIRQSLGKYIPSTNKNVARGGEGITKIIDDFIKTDSGNVTFPRLPSQNKTIVPLTQGTGVRALRTKKLDLPSQRVADPDRLKIMSDLYFKANANNRTAEISKTLENIPKTVKRTAQARGSSSQDSMQRTEVLKKFPTSDRGTVQDLPFDESDAINRIVAGTKIGNLARTTGQALNFPASRLAFTAGGAGYGFGFDPLAGSLLAALALGGPVASRYAGKVTKNEIEKLAERVRKRSPEGKKAAAEDTLIQETGRATSNLARKIPAKTALARALLSGSMANAESTMLPPNQENMSRGFGGARMPSTSPSLFDRMGNVINPPIESYLGFDPDKFY